MKHMIYPFSVTQLLVLEGNVTESEFETNSLTGAHKNLGIFPYIYNSDILWEPTTLVMYADDEAIAVAEAEKSDGPTSEAYRHIPQMMYQMNGS